MNAALAKAPTANHVLTHYQSTLAALRVVERTPKAATAEPGSPYFGLPEQEFVKTLRSTREELDQQVVMMLVATVLLQEPRELHRPQILTPPPPGPILPAPFHDGRSDRMLRIQKLVLQKFPHMAPGTLPEFGPGPNVLLGKYAWANAAVDGPNPAV